MVNRADFDRVKAAMEAAGFVHYELVDVRAPVSRWTGWPAARSR